MSSSLFLHQASQPPVRRPRRAAVVLVVLCHGLLVLAWLAATRPAPLPPSALAWLSWPHAVAPRYEAKPVTDTKALPPTPRPVQPNAKPLPASAVPRPTHSATGTPATPAPEAAPHTAPPVAAASAPAAATSAPEHTELLIHSEAARRAAHQVARERSASREARTRLGQDDAPSAQERLGQGIKQAGKGDCLKGDFAGAGLGLLSLPFLLAAELMEKCSR